MIKYEEYIKIWLQHAASFSQGAGVVNGKYRWRRIWCHSVLFSAIFSCQVILVSQDHQEYASSLSLPSLQIPIFP